MEVIGIKKQDEVYNKIICEPGIAFEMKEYFKFPVPGAKFMPSYRNKYWDGYIYLFNPITCSIYAGLNKHIEDFASKRNYKVEYLSDLDRKSTRLNSSHMSESRMPSSA